MKKIFRKINEEKWYVQYMEPNMGMQFSKKFGTKKEADDYSEKLPQKVWDIRVKQLKEGEDLALDQKTTEVETKPVGSQSPTVDATPGVIATVAAQGNEKTPDSSNENAKIKDSDPGTVEKNISDQTPSMVVDPALKGTVSAESMKEETTMQDFNNIAKWLDQKKSFDEIIRGLIKSGSYTEQEAKKIYADYQKEMKESIIVNGKKYKLIKESAYFDGVDDAKKGEPKDSSQYRSPEERGEYEEGYADAKAELKVKEGEEINKELTNGTSGEVEKQPVPEQNPKEVNDPAINVPVNVNEDFGGRKNKSQLMAKYESVISKAFPKVSQAHILDFLDYLGDDINANVYEDDPKEIVRDFGFWYKKNESKIKETETMNMVNGEITPQFVMFNGAPRAVLGEVGLGYSILYDAATGETMEIQKDQVEGIYESKIKEGKFDKYIRRAWDYYNKETKIVPDNDDIIFDVLSQLAAGGSTIDDELEKQVEKEVMRESKTKGVNKTMKVLKKKVYSVKEAVAVGNFLLEAGDSYFILEAEEANPEMDADKEPVKEAEGDDKDKAEDAEKAKAAGMSIEDWEKSEADKKHDEKKEESITINGKKYRLMKEEDEKKPEDKKSAEDKAEDKAEKKEENKKRTQIRVDEEVAIGSIIVEAKDRIVICEADDPKDWVDYKMDMDDVAGKVKEDEMTPEDKEKLEKAKQEGAKKDKNGKYPFEKGYIKEEDPKPEEKDETMTEATKINGKVYPKGTKFSVK